MMNLTYTSMEDGSVAIQGFNNGEVNGSAYSHIIEFIQLRSVDSLVITSTLILDDELLFRRVTSSDISGKSESVFEFGSIFSEVNRLAIRTTPISEVENIQLLVEGDIDGNPLKEVSITLPSTKEEAIRSVQEKIDVTLFSMADGSNLPVIKAEEKILDIQKKTSSDFQSSLTELIASRKRDVDGCSLGCTAAAEACALACGLSGPGIVACAAVCLTGLSACLAYCALR